MPLTEAAPDALARTYATSLFELAQSKGGQTAVEEMGAELGELLELARADARFNEFLASRILAADAREASLKRILTGRVSDLVLRFLMILNQKGRLSHLPAIGAAYDELVQEAFGRVEVDVYTAAPLSGEEMESIRARLRGVLNREPILHPYTDPSMIGGLRLQVGDQLIDASVATRLRQMRDRLAHEGLDAIRSRADRLLSDADVRSNGTH